MMKELLLLICAKGLVFATDYPNVFIFHADDALPGWFQDWSAEVNAPAWHDGQKYDNGSFANLGSKYLPNFRKLIDEGTTFANGYATSAACAPSRVGILTGRYPSRGVFINANAGTSGERTVVEVTNSKLDGDDMVVNIATLFSARGYETASFGKWHVSIDGSYTSQTYTEQQAEATSAGFDVADAFYVDNFNTCERNYQSFCSAWNHNQDWLMERTVHFIDQIATGPWMIYCNPTIPHNPGVSMLARDGLCLDDVSECDATHTVGGVLPEVPTLATYCSAANKTDCAMPSYSTVWDASIISTFDAKARNHVASAMWLDYSIGAFFAYLEDSGILDCTIFVYASDNGDEKFTLFEQGTRIPLIFRGPGIQQGVVVRDTPVMAMDFIPTFLDICFGLADYSDLDVDGVSLKSILSGDNMTLDREYIVLEFDQSRAVVRYDGLKFISHPSGSWKGNYGDPSSYPNGEDLKQLYDLTSDPSEQISLASSNPSLVTYFEDLLVAHDAHTIDNPFSAADAGYQLPTGTISGSSCSILATTLSPTTTFTVAATTSPTVTSAEPTPSPIPLPTASPVRMTCALANEECDTTSDCCNSLHTCFARGPKKSYCRKRCPDNWDCTAKSSDGQKFSKSGTDLLIIIFVATFACSLATAIFLYRRRVGIRGSGGEYAASVIDLQSEQSGVELNKTQIDTMIVNDLEATSATSALAVEVN